MRLPLKFRPRISQLVADVIGGAVIIGFGVVFLGQYASPGQLRQYKSIGAWLTSDPLQIPFLAASVALLLLGLAWFTVALINLLSDSPFNFFIVDRDGLTYRNFWGEKRYAWKELGPIQALKLSAWAGRGSQRRHWITADTTGESALSSGTLRIPSTVYLGGGLLVGSLDLATHDAAGWLEEVRQLARIDRLDPDELSEPPSEFRRPVELAPAGAPAPSIER